MERRRKLNGSTRSGRARDRWSSGPVPGNGRGARAAAPARSPSSRCSARKRTTSGRGFERTPPRLAFVDGDVSFLRPGAEAWAPARANLALANGDRLYAGEGANLELQVGARAFLRAGERTELGLESQEPDFLQLRVGAGLLLDLRSLPATSPRNRRGLHDREAGFYRLDVDDTAPLTCRRGAAPPAMPAAGRS
jgi:hypothetical protein